MTTRVRLVRDPDTRLMREPVAGEESATFRWALVLDPTSGALIKELEAAFNTHRGQVLAALGQLIPKPTMTEPATWGVVEASCVHSEERRQWVRHPDGQWWPAVPYDPSKDVLPLPDDWDSLLGPELVRDGMETCER